MGSDDHWDEFTTNPSGLANTYAPYILSGVNDGNDATKLIYLSPQFSGFDFGVSFSPNRFEGETQWTGNSTLNWQRDYASLTNEVSAALRYRGTFGPVGVQTSVVGQWASSGRLAATGAPVTVRQQNVDAYSFGMILAAYGFQVGGEYTTGKYQGQAPGGGALNKGLDASSHWLTSAVYTTGPLAFGVMYGSGTQDNGTDTSNNKLEDRTQTYFGIGATYTIAPGMVAFVNWNQIQDKNIPTAAASVRAQGSTTKAPGAAGTTLATFGPNATDTTRTIQAAIAGVRISF
jgi:predicted porin